MNVQRPTKKERDERVLDLYYNQNKTYREIAKLERICPRDIGLIVNKESKEVESKGSLSKAAQAYEMFQKGKSPMEVAIALDLREPEVTQLYRETWNLKQTGELNRIYLETGGNLAPLLMLHKLAKVHGMKVDHVVRLLEVASNDLPALERRYYNCKSELESVEARKQNLAKIIQAYNDQVTALGKAIDNYFIRCEQEGKRLADLQRKRIKEEELVRHFENDSTEYFKIRKTVEEKVRVTLSNRKKLLDVVASFMIESIRENPKRYSFLITHNLSATPDFAGPDFNPFYAYGLQWPQQPIQSKAYFTEDYVDMLAEDTNNLMEKLAKKLEDEILSDYPVIASQPSLPTFLPLDDPS